MRTAITCDPGFFESNPGASVLGAGHEVDAAPRRYCGNIVAGMRLLEGTKLGATAVAVFKVHPSIREEKVNK